VSSFIIPLLYGQEFLPAVRPLWILLPGVVALSICKVLANEMTGRGRPKISLLASVITLGVNIPLNLILIPQMGMNGGAIATSVAYIVSSIIVLLFFIRVSKNRISDVLILKRSDVLIYTRFIRSVQAEATKKKIL
jgi:O-antigen/teichoic acid export membrane protein